MDISIRVNIGAGDESMIETGNYEIPRHRVEVKEDYVVIEVEVPGVDKSGINVQLVGNDKLLVRAEGDGRRYLLVKELPLPVTNEGAQAVYKNGLLTIKLPIKGFRIGVE